MLFCLFVVLSSCILAFMENMEKAEIAPKIIIKCLNIKNVPEHPG